MISDPISLIGTKFLDKHAAVYDFKFQEALKNAPWVEWLSKPGYFECKEEFLECIHGWIHSTKLNSVNGLDRFSQRHMIIGTTQVFDECYHRYSDKRLRIFRGEYAYHKRVLRDSGSSINAYNSWAFLDTPTQQLGDSLKNGFTDPLKKGDWIIISQPFCGNGNLQPRFEQILDEASRLGGIPVILDCAWYGTCININIDATHPAITAVCFSLSKAIGMGNMRVGIRYSDFNDSMPIAQHNEYNHLVLVSAQLGIYMMEHFGPDYIPNKYRQWQLEICEEAGLTPTNCMHLALGPWEQPWKEKFMIDETYIKVGIREALKARRKGEL